MKKQLTNFLRQLRLVSLADKARFQFFKWKNKKRNKLFKEEHPEVALPPDYLMYESFQLNYRKYYDSSFHAAEAIVTDLKKHIDLNGKTILDWGCGPARIVRHLPKILDHTCEIHGTDYNTASIAWCKTHISDVKFHHNKLQADLKFDDKTFDVIYGLSILTHLSEPMHKAWIDELFRILKPNGILYVTTHGDNYRSLLRPAELSKFDQGELVVRGNVKEGHRMFTAFQPKEKMQLYFQDATILEHKTAPANKNWRPQDIWIVQKQA
ncbi:MAG: class I SAM-dependent methyltransferase [Flavobacteriaceae bacterium]|nr:class I SAM-dependent methyltransferase [Flavobacteriaceae bacterium]